MRGKITHVIFDKDGFMLDWEFFAGYSNSDRLIEDGYSLLPVDEFEAWMEFVDAPQSKRDVRHIFLKRDDGKVYLLHRNELVKIATKTTCLLVPGSGIRARWGFTRQGYKVTLKCLGAATAERGEG